MRKIVQNAVQAVCDGAHYSLSGSTLTVNGITVALKGEEFDDVWDALDTMEGDDYLLTPVRPTATPAS